MSPFSHKARRQEFLQSISQQGKFGRHGRHLQANLVYAWTAATFIALELNILHVVCDSGWLRALSEGPTEAVRETLKLSFSLESLIIYFYPTLSFHT